MNLHLKLHPGALIANSTIKSTGDAQAHEYLKGVSLMLIGIDVPRMRAAIDKRSEKSVGMGARNSVRR